MNAELQHALAELLTAMLAAAKDGTTWAKGEIPLLIQERLQYALFERAMMLVGALMLVALGRFLYKTGRLVDQRYEYAKAHNQYVEDDGAIWKAGACALWGLGGFFTIVAILDIAKVIIAPRVYVVDWLTSMIR